MLRNSADAGKYFAPLFQILVAKIVRNNFFSLGFVLFLAQLVSLNLQPAGLQLQRTLSCVDRVFPAKSHEQNIVRTSERSLYAVFRTRWKDDNPINI